MSEFNQMAELSKDQQLEVIKYVASKTQIRISDLQLKFLCGYHRASKIMDWLFDIGIVGEKTGLIYRDVLK